METKKKFRPCQQFRFLPGEISDIANKADLKLYNIHKLRIFMAVPKVDTEPFKLNPYNLLDVRKLRGDVQRAISIDKQNKELLKKINMINRKGGKVDTYNPIAYRRNDLWERHDMEMKKIDLYNRNLYNLIINKKSVYNNEYLRQSWEKTLHKLKHACRYPLVILSGTDIDKVLRTQPSISVGLERGTVERPLCFLEFQVKDGEYLGRTIIELYFDHVPVTVQNFLGICTGEEGLSYKNCVVHRIIKGQNLETGDITHGNGRGGFSIYGKSFQEENHMLRHTKAGVLSMKRIPPTENNSQFSITFTKMEKLDHKNVVFGKVIKGNDTIFKIQGYGRKIGKPYAEIIISNCGEIQRDAQSLGSLDPSNPTRTSYPGGGIRNCKCQPICQ